MKPFNMTEVNDWVLQLGFKQRETFIKKLIFDCNQKLFYPFIQDIEWDGGRTVTAKVAPTDISINYEISGREHNWISYNKSWEEQKNYFQISLMGNAREHLLERIKLGRHTRDYETVYYSIDLDKEEFE